MTPNLLLPAAVAAALAAIVLVPVGASAQAGPAAKPDAVAGKRVFMRCMACHSVVRGAPPKVGPNLSGVVGRRSGAVPGFRYSAAMTAQRLVWNDATLDRWLQRPATVVPGTSMVFAGLPNAADRQALIAYLKKPVP
jgi:cytochrome c